MCAPRESACRRSLRRLVCGLPLLLVLSACSGFGPAHLQATHGQFGESLNRSGKQELLLNLLRLRHDDTPVFLQVHSITTSPDLDASLELSGVVDALDAALAKTTLGYTEKPTIIYTPMDGQQFVQSLLEPLDVRLIALLVEAGWDLRPVLSLTLESMNGLRNPTGLAGHAGDADFDRVVELLDELHRAGGLRITIPPVGQGRNAAIDVTLTAETVGKPAVSELGRLLKLAPGNRVLELQHGFRSEGANVGILTRPLRKVLLVAGSETRTAGRGERGLVTIRRSVTPPESAVVRVRYEDAWYFIDRSDRPSRRNLALLHQLLTLQAAEIAYDSLSVTITD